MCQVIPTQRSGGQVFTEGMLPRGDDHVGQGPTSDMQCRPAFGLILDIPHPAARLTRQCWTDLGLLLDSRPESSLTHFAWIPALEPIGNWHMSQANLFGRLLWHVPKICDNFYKARNT